MIHKPVIYLDMDGVCCDFVSAAIRLHGYGPQVIMHKWQQGYRGEFSVARVLGIDRTLMWDTITDAGEAFWSNLAEYPWFQQMYTTLSSMAQVVFLSSPALHPTSVAGKLHWLQARYGAAFRDYIFTSQKHLLAHAHALLIDDHEGNVEDFAAAGGQSLLFPHVWNKHHDINEAPERYILQRCEQWRRSGRL